MEKKVIIVTGGAQGIGAAIVRKLSQEKAIIIIWDILAEKAQELIQELTPAGVICEFEKIDITNEEQVKKGFEGIMERHKSIYGLVNNAGITKDNLIVRMSLESWNQVLQTNLTSMFNCCKYAIRHMLCDKEGSIVNISSVVGLMGNSGQANYSASKAGAIGLTKTLAREVANHKIRVNAIAPGFIMTSMTEKLPPDVKEKFMQTIPMNRFGSCEEVANVVLFLLSQESSYITGAVINVNGGLYM
jgi:3-oxoacyl-[acyl-carrier protein] reductase